MLKLFKELVESCRVGRVLHQVGDRQSIKEFTDTEENGDHTENDACDGCSAECPPAFGDDRETDRADSADDRNRECETAERQDREDTADQGHRCE